jgi:nicotinamide riboside transporter PnuC
MYITSWIFVVIALYGTYLNSNQDKRGFYFWTVSNIAFSLINLENGQLAQSVLFFVYTILAVRGLLMWK